MKLVLPTALGPATMSLNLPIHLPCSVNGRRAGIDKLGITSCGVRITAGTLPRSERTAASDVSPDVLASSSLRRNDLGEVDRGVLGAAECGCGLIRTGVKGWFRFTDEDTDRLRRGVLLKGDSADRTETGDPVDELRAGRCSDEMIRWPADLIFGCTFRFRPTGAPDSAVTSPLRSVLLLDVLDRSTSGKVELIVSSRLWTPNELSAGLLLLGSGLMAS